MDTTSKYTDKDSGYAYDSDVVVFDLDGTICNLANRTSAIIERPEDPEAWKEFFAGIPNDKPNNHVIEQLYFHAYRHRHIQLWTGRPARYEEATVQWLFHYRPWWKSEVETIRFRPDGDIATPDWMLKEGWLNELRENGRNVWLAYEDRPSVIEMWQRNNVPVFVIPNGA